MRITPWVVLACLSGCALQESVGATWSDPYAILTIHQRQVADAVALAEECMAATASSADCGPVRCGPYACAVTAEFVKQNVEGTLEYQTGTSTTEEEHWLRGRLQMVDVQTEFVRSRYRAIDERGRPVLYFEVVDTIACANDRWHLDVEIDIERRNQRWSSFVDGALIRGEERIDVEVRTTSNAVVLEATPSPGAAPLELWRHSLGTIDE
ncbi:MAG: hypothetical protein AAGF12_33395 [Myxococcota bacterium]